MDSSEIYLGEYLVCRLEQPVRSRSRNVNSLKVLQV